MDECKKLKIKPEKIVFNFSLQMRGVVKEVIVIKYIAKIYTEYRNTCNNDARPHPPASPVDNLTPVIIATS